MTIFDSNLLTSYLLPLAIVIVILLLLARYILSRAMKFSQFIAILGCRLIAILLICGLMKLIYSTVQEDKVSKVDDQTIILLEDRSGSMEFLGHNGKKRSEVATEIIDYLKTQIDDNVKLEHLCFADIAVPNKSSSKLNPKRSQIKNAILSALQQYSPKYIYLISDGAGESLPTSFKPFRQQLINSNRYLYVTNPGVPHPDFKLSLNDLKPKNPTQVSFNLTMTNGEDFETDIDLDFIKTAKRKRLMTSSERAVCPLPKMSSGKHFFTITPAKIPSGDLIAENNIQYGTYEISPEEEFADKILVLTSRFNRECREIHAELVKVYGDKVEWALTGKKINLDISEIKTLVAVDIAPKDLTNELRSAIVKQKNSVAVIYSGGKDISAWAKLIGKKATVGPLKHGDFLAEFNYKSAQVVPLLYPIDDHDMKPSYVIKDNKKSYPLLVSDREREPRLMAIMTPNSWAWKSSDDDKSKVRFKQFWRHVFAKSYGEIDRTHRLDISVTVHQFSATIRNLQKSDKVGSNFGFHISSPGDRKSTLLCDELKLNQFFHDQFSAGKNGIYFVQAFVTINGEELTSERCPLAINSLPIEANNAHCKPELLANLSTSLTAKVDVNSYKATIAEMLSQMRHEPSWKVARREKNLFGETLLFILIFTLLCLEWFLERKVMKQ